jgi:ABC-type Fe3+ transport system substrate-binding protein
VPITAPHRALGAKFVQWLLSGEGAKALRAAKLDALSSPVIVKAPKTPTKP